MFDPRSKKQRVMLSVAALAMALSYL